MYYGNLDIDALLTQVGDDLYVDVYWELLIARAFFTLA